MALRQRHAVQAGRVRPTVHFRDLPFCNSSSINALRCKASGNDVPHVRRGFWKIFPKVKKIFSIQDFILFSWSVLPRVSCPFATPVCNQVVRCFIDMADSPKLPSSNSFEQVISLASTARASTNTLKELVVPGAPQDKVAAALTENTKAHADVLAAATALLSSVPTSDDTSSNSIQLLIKAAKDASEAATGLSASSATFAASIASLREKDNEMVESAKDARAVAQTRERNQRARGGFIAWLASFESKDWFRLFIGVALVAMTLVGAWGLFRALYFQNDLLNRISDVEYARGLITYLFVVGTIIIALLLTLAALLGNEDSKDSFTRGKEVLTALIGILGTILGFYFASEKGAHAGKLELSPVAVLRKEDNKTAAFVLKVAGGKAPYQYSVDTSNAGIAAIPARSSSNGSIKDLLVGSQGKDLPEKGKLSVTLTVVDADNAKASVPIED